MTDATGTIEPIGAAIHADLYREEPDPARDALEARKLGLGFVVFFSCLIGGLSLALNQALSPDPVISVPGLGEGAVIDDPSLFTFVWSERDVNYRATRTAILVDNASDDSDAVPDLERYARVRVVSDRDLVATLYANHQPPDNMPLSFVRFNAGRGNVFLPARPGYQHAWEEAKLFGVLPTRYFIFAGLWLGLVCMVPPLGVPLYKLWMGYVARPLAWLNTRLILSVVFFALFSPVAIFLAVRRLFKPETDSLGRASRPPDQTYWSQRAPRARTHFERWF